MPYRVRGWLSRFVPILAVGFLPITAWAQAGSVTGRVTGQGTELAIAAAQVSIPALNVGTLTGADGSFTLPGVEPGRHELRVVRIGYRAATVTVEVPAGGSVTANVQMAEAALALDEIVVTGTAGQARRREVGNSISQVSIADVKQPVQSLETMLQGRSAGVVVPTGNADMGGGSPIRLRGNASLSLVSYPLIYIDGIRQTAAGYEQTRSGAQSSMLSDIDPATIDRVEIVKGPAATALYGTEAAAGVIQIFTKKGTPGRTTWTFQTDQGVRWVRPWGSQPGTYATGLLDTILTESGGAVVRTPRATPLSGQATQPCIDLADQAGIDAGRASGLAVSGCHRPYHDMDPYLQSPHRQRYTLSVAGGSDVVRFFTSGTGEGGKGVTPNDQDLRYQFRSNVSFHPSSKLNVDVSAAYTRYRFDLTAMGNGVEGLYFQVVRRPLNGPATYNYAILDSILELQNGQTNDRMILGVTANWSPIQGMSHKFTVGYDDARTEAKWMRPYNYIVDRPGRIGLTTWGSRSLSTDYVMSQRINLLPTLSATVSAGGQLVQRDESRVELEAIGLPGPGAHTVSSASSLLAPEIEEERVVTGGFLFQNMFSFKDRYFFTAGVRIDGNSAFGEDLGLQSYPKGSLSYVISDEPFWPRSIGTMKLRAAYGWAGRAPGAFDATRTWTPQLFAGGGGTALIPDNYGNPELGPERSRELELGADASVLNDRVTIDFSWYHRVTNDALLQVARPASQGNTNSQLENVGKFENKGIELGVTASVLNTTDFGIELQATLATNYSKVLEVGTATVNNIQIGQPAPVVRATKVANAYDFADPIFEPDSNNFYGPNLPTRTITMAPTFRFPRNVTLTLRGEWQKGAWVTQGAAHFLAQRGPYGTPSCDEVYRLVPWDEYHGPYGSSLVKTHPNLGQVNAVDRARCYRRITQSNLFTWPADFFKLREITLQAPLPFRLPQVQTAMVTLSVRNILTLLDDRNNSNDPEVGGGRSSVENLTFGFSDAIPAPAEFTFSLRATF